MSAPDVSVVIPLYNDAATIGRVLSALERQETDRSFEVIVVDDGSSDGGGDLVRAPHRMLRQANAGPAAARNTGARAASGSVLLFLDADCMPPANWIAELTRAIVPGRFDAAMGTIRAANDGVVPRLVQLEVADRYRGMAAAADGVDFLAAPACGIRADVFAALGGFDERLRQAEDVEFAYRLTGSGYRIAFVQGAPVAHDHQDSWSAFLRTKFVRAVGRLRVFELFPDKRRHDSWTPLSLKLQFGFVVLGLICLVSGVAFGAAWWLAAIICAVLAILLGWPLVRTVSADLASLTGPARGLAIGAGFVLVRSLVILAAMVAVRSGDLGRRLRWRPR